MTMNDAGPKYPTFKPEIKILGVNIPFLMGTPRITPITGMKQSSVHTHSMMLLKIYENKLTK